MNQKVNVGKERRIKEFNERKMIREKEREVKQAEREKLWAIEDEERLNAGEKPKDRSKEKPIQINFTSISLPPASNYIRGIFLIVFLFHFNKIWVERRCHINIFNKNWQCINIFLIGGVIQSVFNKRCCVWVKY